MNDSEYKIRWRRGNALIGIFASFVILVPLLYGLHTAKPKQLGNLSASWPMWLAVLFCGFVLVVSCKNLVQPKQILLAGFSGITLGSGRYQRHFTWAQVQKIGRGEIIPRFMRPRGYGHTPRRWPALRIDFDASVSLDGVYGDLSWGGLSPDGANAYVVAEKVIAAGLDHAIETLTKMKEQSGG